METVQLQEVALVIMNTLGFHVKQVHLLKLQLDNIKKFCSYLKRFVNRHVFTAFVPRQESAPAMAGIRDWLAIKSGKRVNI